MDNFVADAIFIDLPPERLFEALLAPESLAEILGAESVVVEARVGGGISARLPGGASARGAIAAVQAPRRLEIRPWIVDGDGVTRGPLAVAVEIEPRHGGAWITARIDGLDRAAGAGGGDWKPFALAARRALVRGTVALKRRLEGI